MSNYITLREFVDELAKKVDELGDKCVTSVGVSMSRGDTNNFIVCLCDKDDFKNEETIRINMYKD